MKKICLLVILLFQTAIFAQENRDIEYIRKYAYLAVQEQQLYKIPASIKLAQGLIETGGGQSRLAEQGNNHFGIKCKTEWTGRKIYHNDDAIGECFRVYDDPEQSYRDHSIFLAERPYYKNLFTLDLYDYKAWAYGLKKAGYATNPRYPSMLISRIEKYNLDQFDRISVEDVLVKLVDLYGAFEPAMNSYIVRNKTQKNSAAPQMAKIETAPKTPKTEELTYKEKNIIFNSQPELASLRLKNHPNNIRYVTVKEGESINDLAKTYKIEIEKLAEYNEITPNTTLKAGQIVFLNKKKSQGYKSNYVVEAGDDMYSISQRFGVKIINLYKYNRMSPGTQPKVGQLLNLQKRS
ncbi:glucosaminidase domain-containing protein [Vaginella massiliensis]|uniref:glucosaminidase domain-containing protein n=1 Tax=Vaginella massiliensis TaxID=1816680 RepID=UPI0008398244|nr:glucosaminidase domain-containing protein [Vaginella massiliensis]